MSETNTNANKEGPDWSGSVDNDHPQFAATLVPYRSLGRNGFLALMAFVAINCFMSGMMFLLMGAWPVVFFLAADVLVIWAAFHFNYKAAKGYEEVAIWRHELRVRKTAPSGKFQEFIFNPFWTRFKVDRHEEIGITQMVLTEKNRSIPLGQFLNPDDRESFALAFGQALAKARA